MPGTSTMTPTPVRAEEAVKPDLWKEAFASLSAEDQKQYEDCSSSMLSVLKQVHEATESKKQDCVSKGWKVYQNKKGEEVKLRHVLEKIAVWVKGLINVVDTGVSFDQSGHAALPWAIVKYLITISISDINLFSSLVEGIESSARLVARYVVIEKLYLDHASEAALGLQEAIKNLYATVLTYLARVKTYFTGGTLRRIGRAFLETIRNEYAELLKRFSETEVEQWTRLVEEELHQRAREDVTEQHRMLKHTLAEFKTPIVQMSDQMSTIHDTFHKEERRMVFRWMSEIEYRSHHDDLSKNLLPQSGRWLLDSQEFIEWGQSSVSSVLWLHGIPGSGKTKLASTVINLMLDANSASTAFFYCARSTAEPARAKPVEILCALLRQLCTSTSDQPIKNPVAREYEARKEKAEEDCSTIKRLTVEECTRLIIELTKDHPATIIIDALDECEEITRHELLEALDSIIRNSANVVKIFVSSRDDNDIKLHLEGSRNIYISVEKNSADITRFVESEVQRLISKRLLLDGKVPENLRERILDTLINGAQGMFRWVEMSLEHLSRIKYKPDFKKALGRLPNRLSGLYDIIYTQIDQTETYGRRVAIETLTWLLCAQRLLTAEELLAAVHVVDAGASSDSDEGDGNRETSSPENDVLRLCRNLVVIDTEQRTFRFAHQSVREFLLGKPEYSVMRQHALATERCLDVYLTQPSLGLRVSRSVQQNDILRNYAGAYWPVHYTYIGESDFAETHEKMSRFLMEGTRTSHHYIRWASSIRSKNDGAGYPKLKQALGLVQSDRLYWQLCSTVSTPETYRSVACAFGFSRFLKEPALSINEVKQRQKFGTLDYTFLLIAVEFATNQIVQLLLGQGADINAQGGRYGDALCTAICKRDDKLVQILLDKGADINTEDNHRNALLAASHNHNNKMMQMLLEKKVDFKVRRHIYGEALGVASDAGFEKGVQMLLDKGVHLNALDYGEALWSASSQGHKKVVQMLLAKGADIDAQYYGKALQRASYEGHEKVVQMLLAKGADIDTQYYGLALERASDKGHEKVVQMVLDKGVDLNAQDYGEALQRASSSGHEKVVQMLLDKGVELDADDYGIALWVALDGGHEKVVQVLFHKGVAIEAQDYGKALWQASERGLEQVVQMLLDKGVDVNAQGGRFGNPLQAASYGGHNQVVQLLLDKGADINTQGGCFDNALHAASYAGYNQVVRLLLNHNAVVNKKDVQGRTAFHLASARGQMEVIKTLLSFGADPTTIDMQGRNSLHHAASDGSIEMVRWLLKNSFDPNYTDWDGWSSLHWAARNRSDSIMEILMTAGARSTVEAIKGWTPDSVAIFHHNDPSSRSREHAGSERPAVRNISSSTAAIGSLNDDHEISPGILHNGYNCDGCNLDIYGPRFKCLDCLDFDFCFKCKNSSDQTHAGHRFEEVINSN